MKSPCILPPRRRGALSSRVLFPIGGTRSALGGSRLFLFAWLLLHPGGVLCLGILHPRRLLRLAGVLADRAAGGPVVGARLLLLLLRRGSSSHVSALRFLRLRHLARRLGEFGNPVAGQVFEHLADDRGGELQVQCQALGAGQNRVVVRIALVAEILESAGDVLRGDEGVSAGDQAQVLQERQVEALHHPDDRLGLEDAPPDEEAGVVTVRPAPQNLALTDVVVLGDPVLELAQETSGQDSQVFVAEEPRVVLDAHDAADARYRERILLVLESIAEAAHHLADLLPGTPALRQCGFVDHERRRLVLGGELLNPPGGPLQPWVVVFKVFYLPGGLDGPIRYLNHGFSSVRVDAPDLQYIASLIDQRPSFRP